MYPDKYPKGHRPQSGGNTPDTVQEVVPALFMLPLFVSAGSSLASALITIPSLFLVYLLAAIFTSLLGSRVPRSFIPLLPVLSVLFFSWFAQLLMGLLFPLASFHVQFALSFIPITCLCSLSIRNAHSRDMLDTVTDAAVEALFVSLLLLAGGVLREFLSSFSLTVPSVNGVAYLFSLESLKMQAPGGFAGAFGAFVLFALFLLIFRSSLFSSRRRPTHGRSVPVQPEKKPTQAKVSSAHTPPARTESVLTEAHTEAVARDADTPSPIPAFGPGPEAKGPSVATPGGQGYPETEGGDHV